MGVQAYNDLLTSSGTDPRVDNLADANLCFYSLSCTTAKIGMFALSVFRKNTRSKYAQYGL